MAEADYDEDLPQEREVKIKAKGRGHRNRDHDDENRYDGRGGVFEGISQSHKTGPAKCKYQWSKRRLLLFPHSVYILLNFSC